MKALISRYPVLTLVTLTLGVQFAIVLVTGSMIPDGMRMHDVPEAHMVFRFRVFWPLVFAVLLTWYMEGMPGMRKLFGAYTVWRVPGKWYAFSLTWKFMFCYAAWIIADLAGWLPWPGAALEMFSGEEPHIYVLLRSMPFIFGIALVEETTWMKYCATRLQEKYPAFIACFVTGIVWGLWYLPMLLLHEGVPDGVPWYMFLLSMAALAVLLGWVYNMTRSGLILFIMQVVSNIAFFVMPALPVCHDGDPSYVIGFIWVEVAVATFVVLRYGTRDMGLGPRPTWSDPKIPTPCKADPVCSNEHFSTGEMVPEPVRSPRSTR